MTGPRRLDEVVLFHLLEVVPNRPIGPGILDPLAVPLVEITRADRPGLGDDLVDHALVTGELRDALLADLLAGVLGHCLGGLDSDPVGPRPDGVVGRQSEDADRVPGVSCGLVSDMLQGLAVDGVGREPPLGAGRQDRHQLVEVVAVEADSLAPPEATNETIVGRRVHRLLAVGDQHQREPVEVVQVVEDLLVLQLVGLVEDQHAGRALVLPEAVDQAVHRGRLAVDPPGAVDPLQDPLESPVGGVVSPAVDVLAADVGELGTELVDGVPGDAGLPDPGGTGQERSLGGEPAGNGIENAGEVVDLGLAVLDLPRDELVAEYAGVPDHVRRITGRGGKRGGVVSGSFQKGSHDCRASGGTRSQLASKLATKVTWNMTEDVESWPG